MNTSTYKIEQSKFLMQPHSHSGWNISYEILCWEICSTSYHNPQRVGFWMPFSFVHNQGNFDCCDVQHISWLQGHQILTSIKKWNLERCREQVPAHPLASVRGKEVRDPPSCHEGIFKLFQEYKLQTSKSCLCIRVAVMNYYNSTRANVRLTLRDLQHWQTIKESMPVTLDS
jgi:hypothetical protein